MFLTLDTSAIYSYQYLNPEPIESVLGTIAGKYDFCVDKDREMTPSVFTGISTEEHQSVNIE